ncbi:MULTISPECIES: TlpA family protein disulfide reductase [Caproicibacterium]|uniref:TlpA disulfide reductase family protein n=1 Tax=Caproicibacterium argilliputei TaxID=3030016 RepID=A0AA97H3G3_9FIRM|nr:TlpA disulfide reductase family protein [Caproicibacterium argilliputei]WOC33197.1 TlpA disulfide reductase family protein [Caproicibacterium argilliputei]
MKKTGSILALTLALVTALSGCGGTTTPSSVPAQPQSSAAASQTSSQSADSSSAASQPASAQSADKPVVPDFTLESSSGKKVSLSDYSGKVVVLNFWASWCVYCKKELPDFQKLNRELQNSKDVVLLLLDQTDGQTETKQKGDAFLKDNGYSFLNLYDSGTVSSDIFGVTGYPTTVVIDKQGRFSSYVSGMTSYEKVKSMIAEAM